MWTEEQIEKKASELGFQAHIAVCGIYIKSRKGNWILSERDDGKWVLQHQNYRGPQAGFYHLHDKAYPDPINAMLYIDAHDRVQYTTRERIQPRYRTLYRVLTH